MLHRMREDNSLIIHRQPLTVPDPSDPAVDILYAKDDAIRDANLCAEILQANPSMEQIIQCERNVYHWILFWSVREPDPELRRKYAREAKAILKQWEARRAKAADKPNSRNSQLVLENLRP